MRTVAAVGLATIVAVTTGSPVAASDSRTIQADTKENLLRQAERYLSDRAERVTEKYHTVQNGSRINLTSVSATDAFSARLVQESSELDARRERLRGYGGGFSSADVRLDVQSIEIASDTAHLRTIEHAKLFYSKVSPGAPTHSSYSLQHNLTFVFNPQTGWLLSGDQTNVPASAIGPFTHVTEGQRTPASSPGVTPTLPGDAAVMSIKPAEVRSSAPEKNTVDGPPYDYAKMAEYARRWAKLRNPAFPQFGNDCMNFVSQSLLIGEWDQVRGDPNNASSWYVNSTSDYSRTWSISHEWYFFARVHSQRTTPLTYFEDLRIADVVQVDWDNANGTPTPDGHLDHTMIVTQFIRPALDGIYLSYHTNDTLDRRLDDLLAQVPADPGRANYYGHRT